MSADENLFVFWDGYTEPVGYLAYARKGRVKFRYAGEWLQKYGKSISLRLPCSQAEFTPRESTDFFENLLPEDRIYESLCRKYHIDEDDIFKFLSIFGRECAGALSVAGSLERGYSEPPYRDITETLIAHLEEPSPQTSLIEGLEAKLSLAGAQNKLAVHLENGRFLVPNDGSPAPTTAILKSVSPWFRNLHRNEHFCMSLARAVGLKVPGTRILTLGKQEAYLIERYDRVFRDGRIVRLHQEDFCQALGYRRLNKYQGDQGPDFAKCNELLMRPVFGDSLPARREFTRCAIFNYLIGNCDAHAKNFSILYQLDGRVVLAPFYDLVSSTIYEGLSKHMSMFVGGTANFYHIKGEAWKRFSSDLRFRPEFIAGLMADLIEDVRRRQDDIFTEHARHLGDCPDYPVLRRVLADNTKKLEEAAEYLASKPKAGF